VRTDYVVDASVALKWFFPEEGSEQAVELAASRTRLLAPRLIIVEVANALWKKVRAKPLPVGAAQQRLAALPRYFHQLLDLESLVPSALASAAALDHPVYDLIYLEAARQEGAPLLTADRRLARKLAGTPDERLVVHLADWRAA